MGPPSRAGCLRRAAGIIGAHQADTAEIYRFMDEMSDEARRLTFELNQAFRTQEEVRELMSRLLGKPLASPLRIFPRSIPISAKT